MNLQRLVSNSDYCNFLNKVAVYDDIYNLWNDLMQEHFWGGITKETIQGHNIYSIKNGYENLPITCVTWVSVIRYCNWLSYGQPTGDEVLGITEGDAIFGVYDTSQLEDESFIKGTQQIVRKTCQAFFLPTLKEWRNWRFATGYEKIQTNVYNNGWARPFPHLASVNEDVRGNVGEWVETRQGNFALALGGSLIRGEYSLNPLYKEGDEIDKAISSFGFRVASADKPIVLQRPVIADKPIVLQRPKIADKPYLRQKNSQAEEIWCRIGHKKNPPDRYYNVGRVNYEFEMCRFALTNAEWCEFLNSVAIETDPFGLYNLDMATGVCGGIERIESSFAVKSGWEQRPVVYIGYSDVMRYCNWLHYGKPQGECILGVTEGNHKLGAYDTRAKCSYHRNSGAKYFIPTDDEWCKAAYFDPTKYGANKYWEYPCRSSDVPSNDPHSKHACNYLKNGTMLGEKGPFFISKVDDYPTSDTYFGCRQMGGNVWEWIEPVCKGKMNLRGGSFGYTELGMGIWNRDEAGINDELYVFGARIARAVDR